MKFGVFILSHERADRVETYNTLKIAGYTGPIKIVIDDKDKEISKYMLRFNDELIIFEKEKYIGLTDTLTQIKSESSAVYARNFIDDYIASNDYDAAAIFDDDIVSLRFRWIEDGVAKSQKAHHLDYVMRSYFDFIAGSRISTISFEQCMFYLGGVSDEKICNERWTYQIHIRNPKYRVRWSSIFNEDIITEITTSHIGYLWWSLPHIVYDAAEMGKYDGGVKTLYESISSFNRAFLACISQPGCCKVGYSHGKIRIVQDKKASWPMIISSRYKK